MTATATYGALHDAFQTVARQRGLVLSDVRLVVAIHEAGGHARTDELETLTLMNPTAIRRSSLTLRRERLASADGGDRTKRARRGTRVRLVLTPLGRDRAIAALRTAQHALTGARA